MIFRATLSPDGEAAVEVVGCCDSSPSRHATKHFQATEHPIVYSLTGGNWRYCYVDEILA